MAVSNIKGFKPIIWIPPSVTTEWKLTVERSDGTIDDITDLISSLSLEEGVTEGIGQFNFSLWNPNNTYTNVWTGNEIVRYYSDYATTATTLTFRGRIAKPSYNNNKVNVRGRTEGVKLMDVTVTKQYDNVDTGTIIKDLFSTYGQGVFTVAGVSLSGTTVTKNWFQRPFWDAIAELGDDSSYDTYINPLLDVQHFLRGSKTNTTDAIIHDYNLIETGDFGKDLDLIKNRVIVYGATQKGIQVIHTEESTDATLGVTSELGVRELIVNDENVTNRTQAKELSVALLAQNINPPELGDITSFQIATIQPGEKLRISDPDNNLPPAFYQTVKYKHNLNIESGKFETIVTIAKRPPQVFDIIRNLINISNKKKDTSSNPAEMRYSYNFLFESSTGTLVNTEITNGVLKLIDGQSSGTWTSNVQTELFNIASVYEIMNGQTLTGAVVTVSANNGVDFESVSNLTKKDLVTSVGKNLILKVSITDTNTQIESLSMLYK